jgi:type IV secretion system protein VirB5
MKNKLFLRGTAAIFGVMAFNGAAQAQLAVVDVRAIAQHIQTVRNTVTQIQEAQRAYAALNSLSKVRSITDLLQNKIVQSALPDGVQDSISLVSNDLAQLGAIGRRAEGIINNRDFSLSGIDRSLGDAQGVLRNVTETNAAKQAYGEELLKSTEGTNDDLRRLTQGLQAASTLRDSQDVGASAAIANAAVSNRILQLMAQSQARGAQDSLAMAESAAQGQRAEAANIAAHSRPTFRGEQ